MADLTISDASKVLGVAPITLRRRIKAGRIPEAIKSEGAHGQTWVIPDHRLELLASREGWELDLRDKPENDPITGLGPDLLADYAEAITQAAQEGARADIAEAERDRQTDLATRANKDLEASDAEVDRLATDLGESDKMRAVAEALAAERLRMLEESQALVADADDRAEASFKHAALAESSLGWWGRRRLAKRTGSNL